MRRTVDHRAMAVAGYAAPWSARGGETVCFHLSSAGPVEAAVVRLDDPALPVMAWPLNGPLAPPGVREFDQGSHLRVSREELRRLPPVDGIGVEFLLTRNPGVRTLVDIGPLRLDLDGERLVLVAEGAPPQAIGTIPAGVWLDLSLSRDGDGVLVRAEGGSRLSPVGVGRRVAGLGWPTVEAIRFAASSDRAAPTLNARFARPRLVLPGGSVSWRFPTLLPADLTVPSDGPAPIRLEAVNLPTFCLTSRRWDGTSFDPRLVPEHYDAIHCHDDDMDAAGWPAVFSVDLPADAEPGVYALAARCGGQEERIAFFVRSGAPRAPILFLVPTATYLAYANEVLPPALYPWKCDDRGHRFAADNGLRSLYDFHDDLSGVSIVSRERPMATLRDDYAYPLCGCPHNLPVDLRLLRFCREQGVAYDLATDHDLHAAGPALLDAYAAVMTGSHPEYMSVEMEASLAGFAAAGGAIAYLGGNGFAATVAFGGDRMELRRSPLEAGRTWDGPVAEQALALTNEPGGFLRSRGRGEFSLVGVGISLMGFDEARPFRRTQASRSPACAWLFDGVEGDEFGHDGIVLGGAAGYEVDATDPLLGTAPDTIVVARASGFPAGFFHDPARWYPGGEAQAAGRRVAEMTLRLLPSGGLIFSASSVAWCGALPAGGAINDVGRITLNLLRRLARRSIPLGRTADANQPNGDVTC